MLDTQKDVFNLDYIAIENEARALRAQYIREFFADIAKRFRGGLRQGAQNPA